MKLGKDAKTAIDGDPHKAWLLQALLDATTSRKGSHYTGICFSDKLNYWYSTDGFRLFAAAGSLLPGKAGKFIPKPFAESLALEPVPETNAWRNPDIECLIPKQQPKKIVTMYIPKVVSAADDKNYDGHMTLNFEKDGYYTYLGKLPPEKLAEDHIHFYMANWSHLGGNTVRILYYAKNEGVLVLPAKGTNKNALENEWFSLIMPTKHPGEELIRDVEV
jgi:hypothetical protein